MLPPRYPSDLSDEEWQILEPLLSSTPEKRGRPLTGVVLTPGRGCAVFYLLSGAAARGGCYRGRVPSVANAVY